MVIAVCLSTADLIFVVLVFCDWTISHFPAMKMFLKDTVNMSIMQMLVQSPGCGSHVGDKLARHTMTRETNRRVHFILQTSYCFIIFYSPS